MLSVELLEPSSQHLGRPSKGTAVPPVRVIKKLAGGLAGTGQRPLKYRNSIAAPTALNARCSRISNTEIDIVRR